MRLCWKNKTRPDNASSVAQYAVVIRSTIPFCYTASAFSVPSKRRRPSDNAEREDVHGLPLTVSIVTTGSLTCLTGRRPGLVHWLTLDPLQGMYQTINKHRTWHKSKYLPR